MSNVKEILIEGFMPFDANENKKEMMELLGMLNLPSIGIRIFYNEYKFMTQGTGQYCFYNFIIKGKEALSFPYLKHMVKIMLDNKCEITIARSKDTEEGDDNPWVNLLP